MDRLAVGVAAAAAAAVAATVVAVYTAAARGPHLLQNPGQTNHWVSRCFRILVVLKPRLTLLVFLLVADSDRTPRQVDHLQRVLPRARHLLHRPTSLVPSARGAPAFEGSRLWPKRTTLLILSAGP